MYSRCEIFDLDAKLHVTVHRNRGRAIDVLSNVHVATGSAAGRMLNVAGYWVGVGQGRSEDTAGAPGAGLGIDRGCQSEEEYGSGERFGKHLNKEWMKVRRMAAGSARDRLCRTRSLRM